MPNKQPTVKEMAQWAVDNPGRYQNASHKAIEKHFGVGRTKGQLAVREARNMLADQEAKRKKKADGQRKPAPPDNLGLVKENQRLKKELAKREEVEHALADIVKELVPGMPAYKFGERKLPKARRRAKRKNEEYLMLDCSDWQVGMLVRPADTMHLGGYNFEIFKERLRYMRDVVLTVFDEQCKVRPVKRLLINFVGDLLEGVGIYKGQEWFLDLHLMEQFLLALDEIAAFVRDLGVTIPQIELFGVWGNHGRIGRKGENPPQCNAEWLLLKLIQRQVASLEGVESFMADSALMGYKRMGEIHLLAHGDKTRGWMGIPFYGLTRDSLKYVNMTQLPVHYVHVAHHHRQASWHETDVEVMLNGAMCGPTPLGVDDFKSAEPPIQMLYRLHPEHGINWRCPIRFEKRDPMQADDDGVFTPHSKKEGE